MRLVSPMVIGQPCLMHHSSPGEMRSFTLSTFCSVILSPGATSARAAVPTSTHAARAHAITLPFPRCIRIVTSGRGVGLRDGVPRLPGPYTAAPPAVNGGAVTKSAAWGASAPHRQLAGAGGHPSPGQGLEKEILVVA